MSHKLSGACLLTALLTSAAVHADDSGFYLGAGFGEATQSSAIFDGSDTSFRLVTGYSFSKNLAVEGGFVDGGKQEDTVSGVDVAIASEGVFVSLLGKLPIGKRFAPYAKVGYVFYDTNTTFDLGNTRLSEKESDEDLVYGGGLELRIGEHFQLRADYEKVDVPDAAFDVYTLIGTWRF